jgi:hypothetical protein
MLLQGRVGLLPQPVSDQFSLPSRPKFRDLLIYEGPFDLERVASRLFEWYTEVDPAAAERHAGYVRGLAGQGLSPEQILRRSYDQLYQSLYDYCAPGATWGWEVADLTKPAAHVGRLGFWPYSHELRPDPAQEPPTDDLFELPPGPPPNRYWPLGSALQETELFSELRAEDEEFLAELERLGRDEDEPERRP